MRAKIIYNSDALIFLNLDRGLSDRKIRRGFPMNFVS